MRMLAIAAALLSTLALAVPASAHDYKAGSLVVDNVWTRAMPPGAKVGGGFMTITNTGDTADRLLSINSPRAAFGEVHEMAMTDGVMKMRKLGDGLEIPPGATVELKPGGYHVMFMGVKQGFADGESIPAVLVFESAGEVEVEFVATGVGEKSAPAHTH